MTGMQKSWGQRQSKKQSVLKPFLLYYWSILPLVSYSVSSTTVAFLLAWGLFFIKGTTEGDCGYNFFKNGEFLTEFGLRGVLQLIKMITIYTAVLSLPRIQKHFTNTVGQFCSPLVVKTPTEINCRITSVESPPTAELSENFICWTAVELEPWNCYLNYT